MISEQRGLRGYGGGYVTPPNSVRGNVSEGGYGPYIHTAVTPSPNTDAPNGVTPPPSGQIATTGVPTSQVENTGIPRPVQLTERTACPACSCDAEHAHDRQGIYSCSRCGWKFVMRGGQPPTLLTFRTRR